MGRPPCPYRAPHGVRRAHVETEHEGRSTIMAHKSSRIHAALFLRLLTDTLRESTLAGIQKVAPQSPRQLSAVAQNTNSTCTE